MDLGGKEKVPFSPPFTLLSLGVRNNGRYYSRVEFHFGDMIQKQLNSTSFTPSPRCLQIDLDDSAPTERKKKISLFPKLIQKSKLKSTQFDRLIQMSEGNPR